MRILIVEDNPDLAANVGDFLSLRGHAVDFAADGLTGLHPCTVNEHDAAVLDVMLPGLDGIALFVFSLEVPCLARTGPGTRAPRGRRAAGPPAR